MNKLGRSKMTCIAACMGLLLLIASASADWPFYYVTHWNSSGS